MILDRLDDVPAAELAHGVFLLLLSGTSDWVTYEKMRDPRLLPALITIVAANGRPGFADPTLTDAQVEHIMVSAIYLIGAIAQPTDQAVLNTLMTALDSTNERIKLAAAVALGEIGSSAANAQIIAFTEEMFARKEWGAVARLTNTLGKIGDTNARVSLQNIMTHSETTEDKQLLYIANEAQQAIDAIDQRLG